MAEVIELEPYRKFKFSDDPLIQMARMMASLSPEELQDVMRAIEALKSQKSSQDLSTEDPA